MKQLHLHGITNLQPVRGGTDAWYWAMDYTHGDLYEAEEIFQQGRPVSCNRLYLVRYPAGEVFQPVPFQDGCYLGEPVWNGGAIALLLVEFIPRRIRILRFDPVRNETAEVAQLPLSSVKDCYNLLLHTAPLTLTRQSHDDEFEMIWPEQVRFPIDSRESFCFREGERLYFTTWYEDPDYREEVVIRSMENGSVLDRFPGDILIMPNGEKWHLQ